MGQIRKPSPVKLIVGFIFREDSVLKKAEGILENKFGGIDFESQTLSFAHTDYYRSEFGDGLKRKFIGFKKLIPANLLPRVKTATNKIEDKLSADGRRLINIDPGYLDLAKLILASTKDYQHRLYLDKGIYAENTLFYQGKSFRPRDWTYPDYKTPEYLDIFNQIRKIYAQQL